MAINNKKNAIQISIDIPIPKSLQEIPRLDETTHKYLGFEMNRGEVELKEMLERLEGRNKEKLDGQNKRV